MYKLILFILITLSSTSTTRLEGLWIKDSKDLIINVYKYKNSFRGKIHWFKDENSTKRKYDNGLNKDEWLDRDVLFDFEPVAENEWHGKIFNPKTGKTYNAYLEITENNVVIVNPYIIVPIIGEKLIFYKYNKNNYK